MLMWFSLALWANSTKTKKQKRTLPKEERYRWAEDETRSTHSICLFFGEKTKKQKKTGKKKKIKKKKDCNYAWVSKLLWKYKEAYEHIFQVKVLVKQLNTR